jgi:hypothetical protein
MHAKGRMQRSQAQSAAFVGQCRVVTLTYRIWFQVVLEGLDYVLMATGRKPNTRGLGLEEACALGLSQTLCSQHSSCMHCHLLHLPMN